MSLSDTLCDLDAEAARGNSLVFASFAERFSLAVDRWLATLDDYDRKTAIALAKRHGYLSAHERNAVMEGS